MNTSRAANYYLKKQTETGRVLTMGAVGQDLAAKMLLDQLEDEKLCYDVHLTEKSTGLCAVTVNKVDRTCIAILDACEQYPTSHMRKMIDSELFRDCFCLYSTGFFVSSNWEALQLMAKAASEHNKIFGFNLGSAYTSRDFKEKMLEILEQTDVIFCNRLEALDLSRSISDELGIEPA